jgi:uroporphyrinogen-III decarboxylase
LEKYEMNEEWATLTPEEKRKSRLESWLSSEKVKYVSPKARQSFLEREKRINDVIELKTPDRVPIWFNDIGFFPAKYAGITFKKMFYDSEALAAAFKKTIIDFEPDVYWPPTVGYPGSVMEILDSRSYKWPGHGVQENCGVQYVEREYLKAEEIDEYINSSTDYFLRKYLPRTLGIFEPFKDLPNFRTTPRGEMIVSEFLKPDILAVIKKIAQVEPILTKHRQVIDNLNLELRQEGFPIISSVFSSSPFDQIADTYRGMRGIMLDMYRQPDKLIEAMDKLLPQMIKNIISDANRTGNPRVMSVIHHGADKFMSVKQWEKFYWPGFKKVLLAMIDEGLTPVIFLEGDILSRLEYLLELPKGKAVGLIDSTDIVKAKEILGKHMCLGGNIPPLLLQNGTPDEVKEYARKLIDVVGKDGGYLMAPRSSMDMTDPGLVKVWFDFTKEYGVYR